MISQLRSSSVTLLDEDGNPEARKSGLEVGSLGHRVVSVVALD